MMMVVVVVVMNAKVILFKIKKAVIYGVLIFW